MVLRRHLDSVFGNDVVEYHATTAEDLSLYEWSVMPRRIDGMPFHDFQMSEAGDRGGVESKTSRALSGLV